MKCAHPGCEKEAAPKQKYCSREHAPYSYLPGDAHIQSGKSEGSGESSLAEPGDLWSQFKKRDSGAQKGTNKSLRAQNSNEELTSDKVGIIHATRKSSEMHRESVTPVIQGQELECSQTEGWKLEGKIMNTQDKSGTSGTKETGRSIVPTSAPAGDLESQLMDSFKTSDPVSEGKSTSMSLINGSVSELYDLMKNVGIENPERNRRSDPQVVNAACNCAKQIYGLMRLKLDILKEIRK